MTNKPTSQLSPACQDVQSAFDLILKHVPAREISYFSVQSSPATVYTTLTTLLMLVLQRFQNGCSIESVVRDTLANHKDLLPENKRVREGTLSKNSSGFSKARSKLSIEATERFVDVVSQSLVSSYQCDPAEHKTFVIDGTTVTLAPNSELSKVYPPATNQYGESIWPVMQLTLAHELVSGVAMRPEFGAMYGDNNTSEAEQCENLMKRLPQGSTLLADSGYGIFRVVYRCIKMGHNLVFRLTNSRFKSMIRSAQLIETVDEVRKYQLLWKPSAHDRKNNPEIPRDAQVLVKIHSKLRYNLDGKEEAIHVVTQCDYEPHVPLEIYAQRYSRIENDIRDIKVTLNLEEIRAQSDEMVRKEILCGMVAYNMVVQLRRLGAKKSNVAPKRISFRRSLDTARFYLFYFGTHSLEDWSKRFQEAIDLVSTDFIPLRPGRSFPRKAHPKRPKTTKMKQQKRGITAASEPQPPKTD